MKGKHNGLKVFLLLLFAAIIVRGFYTNNYMLAFLGYVLALFDMIMLFGDNE